MSEQDVIQKNVEKWVEEQKARKAQQAEGKRKKRERNERKRDASRKNWEKREHNRIKKGGIEFDAMKTALEGIGF